MTTDRLHSDGGDSVANRRQCATARTQRTLVYFYSAMPTLLYRALNYVGWHQHNTGRKLSTEHYSQQKSTK